MPQGPHIVQPNVHPRFHGALPWYYKTKIMRLIYAEGGLSTNG